MIAKILPDEATKSAVSLSNPASTAPKRATSEEKGKIVAAKKAVTKRDNAIKVSGYFLTLQR